MIDTLGKMDGKMDRFANTVEQIGDELRTVEFTMWGPKGDDGIASEVRRTANRVDEIEKRNTKLDAMRERERGASEAGHELRSQHRRREDRILLDEETGSDRERS